MDIHVQQPLSTPETPTHPTDAAKDLKTTTKERLLELQQEEWKQKALHGKYPTRLQDADVDKNMSVAWMKSAGLKSETEGFIIAAQDQSLNTNVYKSKIIKDQSSSLCRLCHKFDESIDHLTAGCPVLAKTEYIHRHDRIGSYVHWKLCNYYNIQTTEKWYEHKPMTVQENENVSILWDMPIHTDRQINANRPDIVIKDYQTKECYLIDISVPSDRNA